MRCPRTLSLLAVGLLVTTLAACGTNAADGRGIGPDGTATTATTTGGTATTIPITTTTGVGSPPPVVVPSFGELPRLATGEPPARISRCEIDPDDPERVEVEAVVVNVDDAHRVLQGVTVTIRDHDGAVVSSEHEKLWSSVTIGPGRRALLREAVGIDPVEGPVTCELGAPDLRSARRMHRRALDTVALDGCAPLRVRFDNPHDVEVGVEVVVEAFDAGGHSVGIFQLGQWPTEYSQPLGPPKEEDEALAAGATGVYEVDPAARIDDWRTPTDGPVTSCIVVSVLVEREPEPHLVLVD
jgi:hypothetical protein